MPGGMYKTGTTAYAHVSTFHKSCAFSVRIHLRPGGFGGGGNEVGRGGDGEVGGGGAGDLGGGGEGDVGGGGKGDLGGGGEGDLGGGGETAGGVGGGRLGGGGDGNPGGGTATDHTRAAKPVFLVKFLQATVYNRRWHRPVYIELGFWYRLSYFLLSGL